MPGIDVIARATRARTLPVLLAPVCVGGALAVNLRFQWGWFSLTLVGGAALHLGANVLNDYFDDRSGVDRLARIDRSAIATGSGLIETGRMTPKAMLSLAGTLLAVAAAAGIVLAVARGAGVLVLGAIGAAIAIEYVGPPLKLAYRGRGLGEIAIFVAYGPLSVAGAYYVQTQHLEARAFWGGIVPGLLTMLVLYHQNLLHWRADKAAGKMTPVVVLEPERALAISGAAIVVAYVTLVVQVALGLFPELSLIGLIAAFPLMVAWARALNDPAPQRYLHLLGATLGASILTSAAIVVALVLAR